MRKIEFYNIILKDVNMWLHYIEAKNALLVGFDAAIFSALTSSLLWNKGIDELLYTLLVVLICSIITCIWSFLPINSLIEIKKNKNVSNSLLNYAYVSSLDPETYYNMVSNKYFSNLKEDNKFINLCLDYCSEIIENSRIALRKQNIFAFCLKLNILLLAFFVIGIIIA